MALNNVDNGNEQTTTGGDNAPFYNKRLTPTQVSFVISPRGAGTVDISVEFRDGHGAQMTEPIIFPSWISDNANGFDLTGLTAPIPALTAVGSGVGILFGKLDNQAGAAEVRNGIFQSGDDGVTDLTLTDSSERGGVFVGVQNPFTGLTEVSREILSGDFG